VDNYWQESDMEEIGKVMRFRDLVPIAFKVMDRMPPGGAEMVCGPITSGGLGSSEKNLAVLDSYIRKLTGEGHVVFSQLNFEKRMAELKAIPGNTDEKLLIDFYQPIFRSGRLIILNFAPNWQTSFGARWERKQAERFNIAINDLESLLELGEETS
jgi:hypothetical protein